MEHNVMFTTCWPFLDKRLFGRIVGCRPASNMTDLFVFCLSEPLGLFSFLWCVTWSALNFIYLVLLYILIHISMLYVRVCHVWPHVSLFILLLVPYFVSVCFNVFVIQCVGLNLSLSIHHEEFMCDIVHCFALHNNTAELFAALKCKITGRLKQLTQVLVMQHIRSYPWMGDCDDLHMFCTRRVPDWSGSDIHVGSQCRERRPLDKVY